MTMIPRDGEADWSRPIRALLAEVDTVEDDRAVLETLDAFLVIAETMGELHALAWWHANRLLVADADAPRARGWAAFVRTLDDVRAEVFLEVPPNDYNGG